MGNYPPGVNAGHPHFNPPDREHEHEFEPDQDMYPLFEDGKAIFVERCVWAPLIDSVTDQSRDEVYEEYGEQCDERRRFRFEPAVVRVIGETGGIVVFGRDDFEGEDGYFIPPVEQALHDVEVKDATIEGREEKDRHPDPTSGSFTARVGVYEVEYRPVAQTNREAD